MTDQSDTYDHRVARAEIIKVVNNRYSAPVTQKFAAVTKERPVNIAQKHVIIFATIKTSRADRNHQIYKRNCSSSFQRFPM